MVGWLKEFDYTKLSYEEAEQVYTAGSRFEKFIKLVSKEISSM